MCRFSCQQTPFCTGKEPDTMKEMPWTQEKEDAMSDLPKIELLEKTHSFPCSYMFKVIGRGEKGFPARVVAAVREELAEEIDPPYHLRETTGGRYISVTLQPTVQTAQQVLSIYRRLQVVGGLVMLW
jgi:putative lipoic acid-binding regulatory protein